jgi:hypothetical protein
MPGALALCGYVTGRKRGVTHNCAEVNGNGRILPKGGRSDMSLGTSQSVFRDGGGCSGYVPHVSVKNIRCRNRFSWKVYSKTGRSRCLRHLEAYAGVGQGAGQPKNSNRLDLRVAADYTHDRETAILCSTPRLSAPETGLKHSRMYRTQKSTLGHFWSLLHISYHTRFNHMDID